MDEEYEYYQIKWDHFLNRKLNQNQKYVRSIFDDRGRKIKLHPDNSRKKKAVPQQNAHI